VPPIDSAGSISPRTHKRLAAPSTRNPLIPPRYHAHARIPPNRQPALPDSTRQRRARRYAAEPTLRQPRKARTDSPTRRQEAAAAAPPPPAANTTRSGSSSDNRLANLHRRPATATHPPMYRLDSDVMPRGYTICYALASLRERDRHRALQLAGVKRRACSGENTRSTRALHCPISRLLMIRLA